MIHFENVTISYPDGRDAVRDVSLRIARGDTVALLGANGAGKTTLLKSILGIVHPQRGTIMVDDIALSPKTANRIRRKVGMVFQNPSDQLFSVTVRDDIAFGLQNMQLPQDDIDTRVNDVIDALGLRHIADRSPQRISEGEKHRAAIAGVLAMRPDAILFDEPSAHLDPAAKRELAATLRTLPHTLIIATHDIDFAKTVCAKALVMRDGQLAAFDEINSILENDELLLSCGLK